MRSSIYILGVLTCVLFLITSCGSNTSEKSVTPQTFAGYYFDGTKHIACYWTGTTRTALSGEGYATSPVVSANGTIHTAGVYTNGTAWLPCYWTGTTRTELTMPAGATDAFALSVAVSGGKVYTAGYYLIDSNKNT
jgi:hypothetical protein